jgi:murein DD-endopeptidase MepM/ murein hydrolase activator NlpD
MMRFKLGTLLLLLVMSVSWTRAQENPTKPFSLPLALPPGPSTWLFGQPYGNTTGAYNFGDAWYRAGQGLHFGIDISMPCGTPVVAMADGDVIYVDNLTFGSAPHNVILRFPQAGLTALYGHLLDRPPVQQYQPVRRGDVVGYSGDPDLTCDSRPHLHLEVRSLDYRTAYNPVDYIDAPWDMLTSIGQYSQPIFQQDLLNTRQWMTLDDQPPVAFGGARLNRYTLTWPPANGERPPGSALPARPADPLPAEAAWTLKPLGYDGCCAAPWWSRTDPNLLYTIDGTPGQPATVLEWDVSAGGPSRLAGEAPPPFYSPDGSLTISKRDGQVFIKRVADGSEWAVQTGGAFPAISADNSRLLWQVQHGTFVPGATPPRVEIWVSDLQGGNARRLFNETDISASWLDGSRLLVSSSKKTVTTLTVYNTADDTSFVLGSWDKMRAINVAPGGGRLMFYQAFLADAGHNAAYTIETKEGATAQKLPWFGGWRWRDGDSVYYLPFDPSTNVETLHYYNVVTGEDRRLTDPATQPFSIANGDWTVSPDGSRIAFFNAADKRTWLMEAGG